MGTEKSEGTEKKVFFNYLPVNTCWSFIGGIFLARGMIKEVLYNLIAATKRMV